MIWAVSLVSLIIESMSAEDIAEAALLKEAATLEATNTPVMMKDGPEDMRSRAVSDDDSEEEEDESGCDSE